MECIFIDKVGNGLISTKEAEGVVQFVCEYFEQNKIHSEIKDLEVTVVLVDEEEGFNLNKQFRGKAYATDVLSFEGGSESLGDLVLCADVLKRQALENKHSLYFEFAYLTIHGILHLLGYDHEQGGVAEKKMMELQDQMFQRFQDLQVQL